MPFYEYECKNCGHTLEAMQKISDSPLKKCPDCGKSQLKRLMSAPVFRLKGAGWYETDFKSDKDGKRNLADQPDADAPKEEKKDATEGKAKEDTAKDATSKDATAKDAAKPADKAAEKPAEKAGDKQADKKPAANKPSKRGEGSAPAKPKAKRSAKISRLDSKRRR